MKAVLVIDIGLPPRRFLHRSANSRLRHLWSKTASLALTEALNILS